MPSRLEAVGLSRIATVLSQGQTPSEVIEPCVAALGSRVELVGRGAPQCPRLCRPLPLGEPVQERNACEGGLAVA
jgi:hypothetical protein